MPPSLEVEEVTFSCQSEPSIPPSDSAAAKTRGTNGALSQKYGQGTPFYQLLDKKRINVPGVRISDPRSPGSADPRAYKGFQVLIDGSCRGIPTVGAAR
jgi:hypothetical protein